MNPWLVTLLVSCTFVAALAMTAAVRALAIRANLLDVPNARSSHARPVPRGGGVAIVLASLVAWVVIHLAGLLELRLFLALVGGGAVVALVGFLDDRGKIGIAGRFSAHAAAAVWAVYWTGGIDALQLGSWGVHLGWAGSVLSVVAIVWALNLFNFMDGIDGIAASQAIYMAGAGAVLGSLGGLTSGVIAANLVLAAAAAGFLFWNWPPARIFMGDAGSGYLGFSLAVLAIGAGREQPLTLPASLIVAGVFMVDATVTLLRRLARGDRVYEAHRTHAYQWQSRRWGGHLPVTLACLAINLLWLGPWALICLEFSRLAGVALVAAWLPLIISAFAFGSGRRET